MKRATDYGKEYKNGNITIKFDHDLIELAERDEILALATALESLDCYFIGETYCLSNYATGHTIYNAYSDLVYVLSWDMLDTLKSGQTVRLYAQNPDNTEREMIEKEWN